MAEKAQVELTPRTPKVPDRIEVMEDLNGDGHEDTLPVSSFSEAALNRIARNWKRELLRKAGFDEGEAAEG